jgi:hypothetical protein
MSEDRVTEETSQSWFGRIGDAIKGILVGLVLFILAFPLLFWNEGRAVKEYKTLKEGGKAVVSVASDRVDNANDGKLVHLTGKADTDVELSDPDFGVSANALKLKRTVEMYQWKESTQSRSEKKIGGGEKTVKTYTYSKDWSSAAINSESFKNPDGHENPETFPYESAEQAAPIVTLGAFTLSQSLVEKIDNFEKLPVADDAPMPNDFKDNAVIREGGFYVGADPATPKVGDVRIFFSVVKPGDVSVITKQTGNTFEPYQTQAGGTIELLQTGILSADAMIHQAQEGNKIVTWILRLVGFILMWIGLAMILKPLSVLADVLPILGDVVGAGTGIISFLAAAVLSLVTITVAWIAFRPLVAVILILVVVGLIAAIRGKLKTAKAKA